MKKRAAGDYLRHYESQSLCHILFYSHYVAFIVLVNLAIPCTLEVCRSVFLSAQLIEVTQRDLTVKDVL